MISLTFKMDDREARQAFARLQGWMAGSAPLMRAIGVSLVSSTHDRMDAGHSPDGSAFAPLKPAYAAAKRGPGILRESGMAGGLQGSITFRAAPAAVEVGSNKIYAGVHQTGATIKPKGGGRLMFKLGSQWVAARSVTIPARPYIGASAEDEETILDLVEASLDRAMRSGPSSR